MTLFYEEVSLKLHDLEANGVEIPDHVDQLWERLTLAELNNAPVSTLTDIAMKIGDWLTGDSALDPSI